LICSEELGNRHQTPTLIGCMLLRNLQELSAAFSSPPSFLAVFAAISEALDYDRFFRVPSNSAIFSAFTACCNLLQAALSVKTHILARLRALTNARSGALMRTPRPWTGRLV
jgi:hypothetical protein